MSHLETDMPAAPERLLTETHKIHRAETRIHHETISVYYRNVDKRREGDDIAVSTADIKVTNLTTRVEALVAKSQAFLSLLDHADAV